MKSNKILACAFASLAILYHASAFAKDELRLCGIVQEVNTNTRLASVDVKSESCPGLRKFWLPATKEVASFEVDEKKCFFIDSNRCNTGAIYRITKIERD